jgi:GDPmannose 4,6-dehydratase
LPKDKALIFGCAGQDGSLLSKSLIKKGYIVFGANRNKNKSLVNHAKLGIEKKVNLVNLDIRSKDDVINTIKDIKPQEIYNLAAQSSVGLSFSKPSETLETNILGTLNILEALRITEYQGRAFFAGSSEVFGESIEAISLESKFNPQSPYAISKLAAQNLVKAYRDAYKLKVMTGILFNHESPLRNENFVTKKIIKGAIRSSKDENYKINLGNINIIRDWGWAEEYVEAMQIITRSKIISDQIICTGKNLSLKDFIDKVYKKFNLNWKECININEQLCRVNEVKISFGDPSGLLQQNNWKAKVDIDQIIIKLIEDQQKNM